MSVPVSRSRRLRVAGPELTVPTEKNVAAWATIKRDKYSELVSGAAADWRVHVITLEVGSRGWIPPSFRAICANLASRPVSVTH